MGVTSAGPHRWGPQKAPNSVIVAVHDTWGWGRTDRGNSPTLAGPRGLRAFIEYFDVTLCIS